MPSPRTTLLTFYNIAAAVQPALRQRMRKARLAEVSWLASSVQTEELVQPALRQRTRTARLLAARRGACITLLRVIVMRTPLSHVTVMLRQQMLRGLPQLFSSPRPHGSSKTSRL